MQQVLVADPAALPPILVLVADNDDEAVVVNSKAQQVLVATTPQLVLVGGAGPPGQGIRNALVFLYSGHVQPGEDPQPGTALMPGVLSADLSSAFCEVLPTITTVFKIYINGTQVGTCTFDPGDEADPTAYAGVYDFGNSPVAFNANDYFKIVSPVIPDATIYGIVFVLRSV